MEDIDLFLKIISSEKLILIGKMASSIAHEINNPIMIISNLVSLVLEDVDRDMLAIPVSPDSEHYNNLKLVLKECDRITKITKNLLDFSRSKPAKSQVQDVEEILMRALRFMEPIIVKSQAQLAISSLAERSKCIIKQDEIQQVFMNLIHNSLSALRLKYPGMTKNRDQKRIEFTLRNQKIPDNNGIDKEYLVVEVFDDGTGIPKKYHNRIFEPFFTTKKTKEIDSNKGQGLGLGLPFCEKIVQNHGGKIRFETVEGEYTTFFVYLPVFSTDTEPEGIFEDPNQLNFDDHPDPTKNDQSRITQPRKHSDLHPKMHSDLDTTQDADEESDSDSDSEEIVF